MFMLLGYPLVVILLPCLVRAQTISIGGKKCKAPQATYSPDPPPPHRPKKVLIRPVVNILIDENGHAGDAKLGRSSGDKDFDTIAIETVLNWHFKPALCEKVPTPVRISVEVSLGEVD
jgi:protein TonB